MLFGIERPLMMRNDILHIVHYRVLTQWLIHCVRRLTGHYTARVLCGLFHSKLLKMRYSYSQTLYNTSVYSIDEDYLGSTKIS
jgi:hypothetical protein